MLPEKLDTHAMRTIPINALRTRRGEFLGEMNRLLPWANWEMQIAMYHPGRGKGRPHYPLPTLIRYYLLREWFQLSDQAAQEVVTDSMAVRDFLGLGLTWDRSAPDEATFLKFRRLIVRHGLATQIAADTADRLAQQSWKIRHGSIAEVGLMATRQSARGAAAA